MHIKVIKEIGEISFIGGKCVYRIPFFEFKVPEKRLDKLTGKYWHISFLKLRNTP